jgi:hypothetical protein
VVGGGSEVGGWEGGGRVQVRVEQSDKASHNAKHPAVHWISPFKSMERVMTGTGATTVTRPVGCHFRKSALPLTSPSPPPSIQTH